MQDDPRLAAARYRIDRLTEEADEIAAEEAAKDGIDVTAKNPTTKNEELDAEASASIVPPRHATAADRAAYVETAIQQAIRRGEFDDLPGAGKPLPNLGDHHDPDWWIRRKIESEQLTGLGPPALRLRVENAELDERLDELTRESDVREALEDFNARVAEARLQLLGGPPVVTPTRDVEAEVTAWRERRDARVAAAAQAAAEAAAAESVRRPWWRRPQS